VAVGEVTRRCGYLGPATW